MAVILDFDKVREDDVHVEYRFGYPEMNRRLTITKESGESRPSDGDHDRDHAAVAAKILRLRRTGRSWPERGSYMA
jgi:hypothetical protein